MFNKDTFSTLLKTAIGSTRSITEFSNECNLARPYISKFINCKLDKASSPEAISKIASAARNKISECDLLVATGYTTYDNHIDDILYNFESGGDLFSNSIKYKTSLNKKYAKLISDVKPKRYMFCIT